MLGRLGRAGGRQRPRERANRRVRNPRSGRWAHSPIIHNKKARSPKGNGPIFECLPGGCSHSGGGVLRYYQPKGSGAFFLGAAVGLALAGAAAFGDAAGA